MSNWTDRFSLSDEFFLTPLDLDLIVDVYAMLYGHNQALVTRYVVL